MSYDFIMPWPPSVNAWKTPFKNENDILRKLWKAMTEKMRLIYLINQGLTGEGVSDLGY
jgi:hypothetical protein